MNELENLEKFGSYTFPGMGTLVSGLDGVQLYRTSDNKSIFINNRGNTLVFFPTSIGVPAFYEFKHLEKPGPVKAVLMDLDGTTVHSEKFWVWIIEEVVRKINGDPSFRFMEEDIPHVSGFSVSEHLDYALKKYARGRPEKMTLDEARSIYFSTVKTELENVVSGKANQDAFMPAPYLKEFLMKIKGKGIKIGLVSSGLHEKAWPEIVSVFRSLSLGNPLDFYDVFITAGMAVQKGQAGTLGELGPKPHPWLYAEALHALQVDAGQTIVIEDSGAGVLSARSAGLNVIGLAGGNIANGGEKPLCLAYCKSLKEVLETINNLS